MKTQKVVLVIIFRKLIFHQLVPKEEYDEKESNAGSERRGNEKKKIQEKNLQLINFFHSYAMFINEASNIILDMDLVLSKFNETSAKFRPPEG